MSNPKDQEEFVAQLASSQNRLLAFILKLTADRETAKDVLQAANLVMWRRADTFEPGTNFLAWAFQIARLQVLSHRQKSKREQLIFSEAFVDELAASMVGDVSGDRLGDRHDSLLECLEELPAKRRDILWRRYRDEQTITEIANAIGKKVDAARQMLHRMRLVLMRCIEAKLSEEGHL